MLVHMNHQEFLDIFQNISKKLPKFSDWRVDYTWAEEACVVTCFVKFQDKILLLKRSNKVLSYKNLWNVSWWYFDQDMWIKEKILEELSEETWIKDVPLDVVVLWDPYMVVDVDQTWYTAPAVVNLIKKPKIVLDREHTDYARVAVDDLSWYQMITGLDKQIRKILAE